MKENIKMRFFKLLLLTLCFVGCAQVSNAKGYKSAKVYMFGFATSFNDSTIYITDIQEVSVFLQNDRTNFLAGRPDYSYQLKSYLMEAGKMNHPTCVTFYAVNKKDIDKKFAAIKQRYITKAKKKYLVETVSENQFKYNTVAVEQSIEEESSK